MGMVWAIRMSVGARLPSGRSPVTLGFRRKLLILGFLVQDVIDLLTQWLLVFWACWVFVASRGLFLAAAHGLQSTGSVVAAVGLVAPRHLSSQIRD